MGILDAPTYSRTQIDNLVDLGVIRNHIATWWNHPKYTFDPVAKRVYYAGINSTGEQHVGAFDTVTGKDLGRQIVSTRGGPDDHKTPSLLIDDPFKEPVIGYNYHDNSQESFIRRGGADMSIEQIGPEIILDADGIDNSAYSQLFRIPTTDTLLHFRRVVIGGVDKGFYINRSLDRGLTWDTGHEFATPRYLWGSQSTSGGTLHFVAFDPVSVNPINSYYFKLTLATGVLTKADGTVIGNAYTDTAALPNASTNLISSASSPAGLRLHDVGPNGGSVLYSEFTKPSDGSAGNLVVRRRQGGTTVNTWAREDLGSGGTPFGLNTSWYFGGGCFTVPGSGVGAEDEVLVCKQYGTVSTLERWTRTGGQFTPGTWAMAETLWEETGGIRIARPVIPQGARGLKMAMVGIYRHFGVTGTDDYDADARLITWS